MTSLHKLPNGDWLDLEVITRIWAANRPDAERQGVVCIQMKEELYAIEITTETFAKAEALRDSIAASATKRHFEDEFPNVTMLLENYERALSWWKRNWDCSGSPGHPGCPLDEAVLEAAQSDIGG